LRFIAQPGLFCVVVLIFFHLGAFAMSQCELEREVSRCTGESLGTIRRRGFSIVPPYPSVFDPDADEMPAPQVIDWDEVDAQRRWAA
jgi:hypothetical protein